jgi:hypothetical protein
MSDQVDPWDAMVLNDASDEEYIPTGADGIDDEDLDFEQEDDDYQDIGEDDTSGDEDLGNLGDIVLSPCIVHFSCVTPAKCGTGSFAKISNSATTESRMLRAWPRCRDLSTTGRVEEWSGLCTNPAQHLWRFERNRKTRTTFTIHPFGALPRASSKRETIGIRRSRSLSLLV